MNINTNCHLFVISLAGFIGVVLHLEQNYDLKKKWT